MDDNRKLKIAMLGHKTMPARDSSRGGIEVVVEELSTRMAAQGHDVTCYNRTGCDNGNLDKVRDIIETNLGKSLKTQGQLPAGFISKSQFCARSKARRAA